MERHANTAVFLRGSVRIPRFTSIFRTHVGRLFLRRLSYSELFGVAFRPWPQDFRVMVERVLGARASEIVPARWALPGTPLAEVRNVCRPPCYSMQEGSGAVVPKSALQGGEEALVCVSSSGQLPGSPHILDDAQPAPQGRGWLGSSHMERPLACCLCDVMEPS